MLLYHAFLEGCAHPTGPDKLLARGELRRIFGEGGAGLEVERDDELPIEEDGRPCSFFRARAPAAPAPAAACAAAVGEGVATPHPRSGPPPPPPPLAEDGT